jgi:hypothetical protein
MTMRFVQVTLSLSKEPALSLSKEPALSLSKEPALSLSKEPALSLSKGDRLFRFMVRQAHHDNKN